MGRSGRNPAVVLALALLGATRIGSGAEAGETVGTDRDPAPAGRGVAEAPGLTILYPFDEALFPPEIAAPTFRWRDSTPGGDSWAISLHFPDDLSPLRVRVGTPEWCPDPATWEVIKQRSGDGSQAAGHHHLGRFPAGG
ncbi:MAG: hypothetical protein ACYDC1_08325 [Limisphaerales bacterium]